ncbi:hypothetical protein [Nocardia sp. NPDC057030]|uniref:hypothetical protein n=1 Tax=unclassified Nocardia TaxID=2637762 RepID=UPI00362C08E2
MTVFDRCARTPLPERTLVRGEFPMLLWRNAFAAGRRGVALVYRPNQMTAVPRQPESVTAALCEPDSVTAALCEPDSVTAALCEPDSVTAALRQPDSVTAALRESGRCDVVAVGLRSHTRLDAAVAWRRGPQDPCAAADGRSPYTRGHAPRPQRERWSMTARYPDSLLDRAAGFAQGSVVA